MCDNYRIGQILASWGGNLAVEALAEAACVSDVLYAIVHTMKNPTARRVDAVAYVIERLDREDLKNLETLVFGASQHAARRLGYLLERNGVKDVADSIRAHLAPWDESDLIEMIGAVRPSVLKAKRDSINVRWGVLCG